jgi:hypothetical protein
LNVATASIRELLARLGQFYNQYNRTDLEKCPPSSRDRVECPVQLLSIGHSFGGLALYAATQPSLLENLSYGNDALLLATGEELVPPRDWYGDMVVLINPAFEGARFEPMFRVARQHAHRASEIQEIQYENPRLVLITTKSDIATRRVFPLGQFFNTLFERPATSDDQAIAMINTPGHIGRYQTHKLWGTKTEQSPECVGWKHHRGTRAGPDPERADPAVLAKNLRLENSNSMKFFADHGAQHRRVALPGLWMRSFCGNLQLENTQKDFANSPVWNVITDSPVMNGHSDLGNPQLSAFLRQLYHDLVVYPPVPLPPAP